jgi:predicted DsbA family dithiol-disulfide isomerase
MKKAWTTMRSACLASCFAVLSLALGGASCDKKSVATPAPDPGPAVPFETPPKKEIKAEPAPAAATPTAAKAAETAGGGERFAKLAEKLPSPCGKAESLKRTLEVSDPACKSAPFARRFVEHFVKLDAPDDEITDLYRNRFGAREELSFDLRETPFAGAPNAPVTIVEFYDYACPHCKEAAPVLEKFVAEHGKDVALYYKQYPLHKESVDMARGAIAAHKQGKFKDVHLKLFNASTRDDVFKIAKEAGLDMNKFQADFNDPATQAKINADKADGQKARLQGTPTIYMNNRMYIDGVSPDRLSDWVEEELAVNR